MYGGGLPSRYELFFSQNNNVHSPEGTNRKVASDLRLDRLNCILLINISLSVFSIVYNI